MTAYRIVGDQALSEAEFQRMDVPEREKIESAFIPESTMLPLENGMQQVADFVPIGPGKPLTIEIRHVYSGKYPKSGLFRKEKDVAVVSGVKDYAIFAATARALNFIQKDHTKRTRFTTPSAFEKGTPVVAYYPALTTSSLTMSIEMAVDDFPGDFVNDLGNAFTALSGVPLMLPHAGFLMGLGEVTKLASGVGNALFDGKPEFSMTESLNFDRPGSLIAKADFRLLTRSHTLHMHYKYDDRFGMVHKVTGEPYAGDEPYVVVSLDGRERPNLKDFAPTAASASILKKFFNIGDDVRTPIETVVEGIKLASDMRFRDRAMEVKETLDALPADAQQREELQKQLDALLKNIGNDLFKKGLG